MFPYADQSTATGLVAEAWRANMLDGKDAPERPADKPVPPALLAARVAALAPEMPAEDKEHFLRSFINLWPQIDSLGGAGYGLGHDSGGPSCEDVVLKCWISLIATRRKPLATATRRLISDGDEVAYPREYEAMKMSPGDFGTPRFQDPRQWYSAPLRITHRQLALHVEFAPLLAAVFLASRLPGMFFGDSRSPGLSSRPQVMTLLEALLARRPDNMTDAQFLHYVRWLVSFRNPLWPEDGGIVIG